MNVVDGILVTGAAATGVVVAERVRHRGSGSQVRADVTEFGTSLADRMGDATRFVGRTSGRALARSGMMADSLGRISARAVASTGHAMAGGTGAAVGAYAGLIDRVVPWGHHREDRPARRPAATRRTAARPTSADRSSASTRATTRARSAAPKARRAS